LLDEVEKAHPDVFNVLLAGARRWRLTDGQGRTVDFRNTVIIMTSNLGSDVIQKFAGEATTRDEGRGHGSGAGELPAGVHQPHRRHLRVPSAGQAQIRAIVDIQLAQLKRAARRNLELTLDDSALDS
jgi:ATP-dependent Clp protease ATP-binding subunit ClpB